MNGVLLRKWMEEKGLRAEDVAVKLGISYQTVRAMMSGHKPYRTTITVLASLMGVTEKELLEKQGDPPEAA